MVPEDPLTQAVLLSTIESPLNETPPFSVNTSMVCPEEASWRKRREKRKNSLSLFLFLLFLIIFKTAFQFIHFFKSFFQKPFGCGLASVSRFTVNQHRKLLIQLSGSFSESLHVFPVGKHGMGDMSFSIFFSSPNIHELHVS